MNDHDANNAEMRMNCAVMVLEKAAKEIELAAPVFDAISTNTLERMAAQIRTIAKLKRPKLAAKVQ